MKSRLLITIVFIATISYAQEFKVGLIGGLNFNGNEGVLKTLAGNISDIDGDNQTGFHVGLFTRIGLVGFYVQPELLYTNFSTEFVRDNGNEYDLTTNRIDVPVNIGWKILKIARIQAGPVFSYHFDDLDGVSNANFHDFSVAAQLGTGIDFTKKMGVDLRYEFSLGDVTTEFISDNTQFEIEQQPSMVRVNLWFAF